MDKHPQATRILARRSNRAGTRLGATVTAVPPGGIQTGALDLSAQSDRLDVVLLQQTTGGAMRLAHTQLQPGLTLIRLRAARKGDAADRRTAPGAATPGDPVARVRVKLGKLTGTTNAQGTVQIRVPLTGRRQRLTATATRAGLQTSAPR